MQRRHRLLTLVAVGLLALTGCTHGTSHRATAQASGYDVSKGLEANAAPLKTRMTLLVATYPQATRVNAAVEKASAKVAMIADLPGYQITRANRQSQAVLASPGDAPTLAVVFYRELKTESLSTVTEGLRASGAVAVRTADADGYRLALSVPLRPGSELARLSHKYALVFSRAESTELGELVGGGLGVGRSRPDQATITYEGLVLPTGTLDRVATVLATAAGSAPVEVRVAHG